MAAMEDAFLWTRSQDIIGGAEGPMHFLPHKKMVALMQDGKMERLSTDCWMEILQFWPFAYQKEEIRFVSNCAVAADLGVAPTQLVSITGENNYRESIRLDIRNTNELARCSSYLFG